MNFASYTAGLLLAALLPLERCFAEDPGAGADPGARLAKAASELAAQRLPYVERALGGPDGPEQGGLPDTGLDCVTFVEASVLRAGGVSDRPAQQDWLHATRYDDREPQYCTRLHYVSDWVDRNAARGWVRDVTPEVAGADGVTLKEKDWTRGWMAQHGQDPAHCIGTALEAERFGYIAPADYGRIAKALQPGDILVFVAKAEGLDTAHLGIVEPDGGLAMASSKAKSTVRNVDWREYAQKQAKRFAGIRILRVSRLPAAVPSAAPKLGRSEFPSPAAPTEGRPDEIHSDPISAVRRTAPAASG